MQTINKPNADLVIGNELHTRFNFLSSFSVISPEIFDRVFYMEYKGMLRQMKITAAFLAPFDNHPIPTGEGKYDTTYYALELKVAGIGVIYVDGRILKIYDSIDDYNVHKLFVCPLLKINQLFVEKVYKCVLINKTTPGRFVWDGFKPVSVGIEIEIPAFVKFTKESHEPYGSFNTSDYKGFETYELCAEANRVEICDFDDETSDKKEPELESEKTIRLSVEIKESDLEKIKDYINVL